jgi:AcrR family transcriptional regulator
VTSTIPGGAGQDSANASESPRSKRKQIVQAAIHVFLKHGYSATTLQKVADEAHVIRATIYSHFADKHQLFKAIIEELTVNQLGVDFHERVRTATPREFVYLMRDFVKRRKQDRQYLALLRTVIGESERFPELARLFFQTVYFQGMKVGQSFFEQHPELEVKDSQALISVVGGSMMAHLMQQELLRGKEIAPMDLDSLADTLADLITRPPQKD